MKKHPIKVVGFEGTLEVLAQSVFRMRYDKVVEFLSYSQKELGRQSQRDNELNKAKLSALLFRAGEKTGELRDIVEEIFNVCKPFMKDELEEK